MRELHLDDLKLGQPGVTEQVAAFLVQAAIVCLVLNGHKSGVVLKVNGDYKEDFQLYWTDKIDEQTIRTWKDLKETAEYGATAIALLLVYALEKLLTNERLEQSNEADYSLRTIESDKTKSLLEVSGLFKETPTNTVNARVNIKQLKITRARVKNQFDTVLIVVTEFGLPKSKIEKNE